MSWPNFFTFLRLLLTPIFIICFMNRHLGIATVTFLMAGITDGIDGFLARRLNQKSSLGACLDPIADKLLLSSAFVLLAWYRYIPSWLAVVVLSRDVFILLGVLLFFLFNISFEVKPSLLGKATTVTQILTVFIVLINVQIHFSSFQMLVPIGIYATLFLTIISGSHYGFKGYKIMTKVL